MQIKINGKTESVPDKVTVQDVLETRKVPETGTVIVLNDEIVRAEDWQEIVLNGGDQLEFVRIIGGG